MQTKATLYLWLLMPAALMVGLFFLYPLALSVFSAIRYEGSFTLSHLVKAFELYSSDILFTIIIVFSSVAILAVLSVAIAALIVLSPFKKLTRLLGVIYKLPLFIPFIVTAQMMRTFLAKNGLMNNAFVAAGFLTPLQTVSFLDWSGIIITLVWKQLAFTTLLLAGAMSALEQTQLRAASNLGASRYQILFQIILPQTKTTLGVALVLSTVTMMSVLSVPLMIGTGTPTMISADMAFRINSYGDYSVANALGLVSYAICSALTWFYLRHSLKEKGATS